MATTAYHNKFMKDLDKKCTILFLAQIVVVHNSHIPSISNGGVYI